MRLYLIIYSLMLLITLHLTQPHLIHILSNSILPTQQLQQESIRDLNLQYHLHNQHQQYRVQSQSIMNTLKHSKERELREEEERIKNRQRNYRAAIFVLIALAIVSFLTFFILINIEARARCHESIESKQKQSQQQTTDITNSTMQNQLKHATSQY